MTSRCGMNVTVWLVGKRYDIDVVWSDYDREYVATCEQFPSLSWLDMKPEKALSGLIMQIVDAEAS